MKENYNEWPWEHISQRDTAALHYQYGQACHAFIEHTQNCYDECTVNGLCEKGTELNKVCRVLEEQLKEENDKEAGYTFNR